MEPNWIDVADTAVKIGLGALITAVSGFLALWLNHIHENEKERRTVFYKLQEEKKCKYVEFLSQSQSLVQSYLMVSCTGDTEEYKSYLRAFNDVQIISPDEIRLAAYNLLSVVNQFVVINKNQLEIDLDKKLRQAVDENLGLFQKLAQLEVTMPYKK